MMKTLLSVSMMLLVIFPRYADAFPEGGQVVAGQAQINQADAHNMHVNQATNKAIINWKGFSIARPEAVRFFQPGSGSVALNRVTGGDPSEIYGLLQANGGIFLINPNGILVGPSGEINVNAFVASTLDISNEDFLAENYSLTQNPQKSLASIVNQGVIQAAEGGHVSLMAPAVRNDGHIFAKLGKVFIGAGERVTLNFEGNDLIGFAVDESIKDKVLGPDGKPLGASISNTGVIRADGGRVILSAKTAYEAIKSVVNNEGVIEAKTLVNQNGVIKLMGGDRGIVANSGVLDASGKETGQTGGTVHVLGEKVGLFDNAVVDVSGDAGGGTALVGGDFQGKNPVIPNARRSYVGPDASIMADATRNGDGGKVIVWADDVTRFYGSISARGGSENGDGGFAEVSGKQNLAFRGDVDLGAEAGETGTVLLDPENIVLQGGSNDGDDDNDDSSSNFDHQTGNADPTTVNFDDGFTDEVGNAADFDIYESEIEGTDANFILQASDSISVTGTFNNASGNPGDNAGTLALQNNRSLTLETRNSGAGEAGSINLAGLKIRTSGSGSITISSGVGGDQSTNISLGELEILGGTGSISISTSSSAGGTVTLNGNITTDGGGNVVFTGSSDVDLATGSITIDTDGTTDADAGDILFATTGDLDGAQALILNAGADGTNRSGGAVQLGTVGGNSPITNLTVISSGTGTDGSISLNGNITTSDAPGNTVTVTGPVLLGADVTVDTDNATNDGAIEFTGTIDNARTLALQAGTANVTVGGAIGNTTALSALDIDGNDISLADIGGAAAGVTGLTDVNAANQLTFTGTTYHANQATYTAAAGNNLLVNGAAATTFTASDDAIAFNTANILLDNGSDLTVTSGGGGISMLDIRGTSSEDVTLNATGGTANTVVVGAIGNANEINTVAITAGASTTLNGNITTSDAPGNTVTVTGPVLLGADVTVDTNNATNDGAIEFTGTIDNARTLALQAGTAGILISGVVGANTPIASLTATGATIDLQDVTTTGPQSYTGNVALKSTFVTAGNPWSVTGDTVLADNTAVDTTNGGAVPAGADITFNGTLDATTAFTETLGLAAGTTGDVLFAGLVGNTTPLGAITVSSAENVTANGVRSSSFVQRAGDGTTTLNLGNFTSGTDGAIATNAAAGVNIVNETITVNAGITTTGSGIVALNADTATLTIAADGEIVSDGAVSLIGAKGIDTSGNVTTTTTPITYNSGDALTMADGTLVDAGNSTIQLTSTNDMILGGLRTANDTATAVVLNSGGSIIDGGDTHLDVEAVNGNLNMTAGGGIGVGNPLEISVAGIEASAGSSIFINPIDSITLAGLIATGRISVTAGGALTAVSVATTGGADSDDILLTTTAGDIELGTINAAGDADVSLSSAAAITDADTNSSVTADDLSFTAAGAVGTDGSRINTTVAEVLSGNSSGAGGIYLNETDALTLTSLSNANGLIDVTAGGALTAVSVATTGGTGSDDIILTTTAGGIELGTINAAGDADVSLSSAAAITDADNNSSVTADDLSFTAAGAVGASTARINTTVAEVLSGSSSGAGGIYLNETDALTLTSLSNANGLIDVAAGGALTAVNVATTGGADSDDIILATTAGDIELGTVNAAGDADVSLSSAAAITDTDTNSSVTADDLSFTAGGAVGAAAARINTTVAEVLSGSSTDTGGIYLNETDALTLTSLSNANGLIDVTAGGAMTAVSVATTGGTDSDDIILTTTAGDIELGTISAAGDADVSLSSAAAITDADTNSSVTADDLSFSAGGAVGAAAARINTTVAEVLSGSSTGTGGIYLNETDAVTLTSLSNANGAIDVKSAGTLTVDNAGAGMAVTTVGPGTVTLDANGANSDVRVNDGIQSVNGAITVTADNDIVFEADGDVSSTAGNIRFTADADNGGAASGALTMVDGTVIDAGRGMIGLRADGDITLGRLVTTNTSNTAVALTSTEGGIVDGGDTGGRDVEAVNGRLVIDTVTGVGSAGTIETEVASLDIDNATSGNIDIAETNTLTVVNAAQASAGNIQIVTGGTLTVDSAGAGRAVSTVGSGTVTLDANGAASDVRVNDRIQSVNGNILLTADDGVTVSDTLESVMGDINISGTAITTNAKISTSGNVAISGTGNIAIAGVVEPKTASLNSQDDVAISSLVSAVDQISVTAGSDGSGDLIIRPSAEIKTTGDGSNMKLTAGNSILLDGKVETKQNLILTAQNGVIDGQGQSGTFSAEKVDIEAQTLGIEHAPTADVFDFTVALSQKTNINLSGQMFETSRLDAFPPPSAVSLPEPAVFILLNSGHTYGLGTLGQEVVPQATSQQIRLEQEMQRASRAEFFREESVIIEIAYADLSEELEEELEKLEEEEEQLEEESVLIEEDEVPIENED